MKKSRNLQQPRLMSLTEIAQNMFTKFNGSLFRSGGSVFLGNGVLNRNKLPALLNFYK